MKVVVVGAGAAGLIAAGRAAELGHDVVLIEKNRAPGKKVLISGKGRCNLTNNADLDTLMNNIPGNSKFLYSAFSKFGSADIINFFEGLGVKTKVERGERVFPVSDSAKDIVDALYTYIKKNNVQFMPNTRVKLIKVLDSKVVGVITENEELIKCDRVIIATGGLSYQGTGSTGDGYKMARNLGHKIITPRPSLIPLNTKEKWVAELQGLSLKNVNVKFSESSGKKIYEDFGEMLFTHFGVSGPVILSASRHLLKYDYKGVKMSIDLKPALDDAKLDLRILRDFEKYNGKFFKNALNDLLPVKLIPVIIKLSRIEEDKFVNRISKEERKNLVHILKNLECTIVGSRPISEAIITVGGIDVKEIKPTTMESKIVSGLHFAGEIIDADGYTGGFNLTIAFSTGFAAGSGCST